MVREVRIKGGIRRTKDDDELARCEAVNRRRSFTAREILCFMHKESLVRHEETGRKKKTRVSDVTVERLLYIAGLNKEQLEERMVQAAFEAFAPGRPVIPSERYLMVYSCRRTVELGKAYNLNSKLPWTTLRGKLNMKRKGVINAYRDSLLMETGLYSEHAEAPVGQPFQPSFDNSAGKLRRPQEVKGPVTSMSQVACDKAVASPSRASFVPSSRAAIFYPDPCCHAPASEIEQCCLPSRVSLKAQSTVNAQDTSGISARKDYPSHQEDERLHTTSRILSFVNTRRKKLGVSRTENCGRHLVVGHPGDFQTDQAMTNTNQEKSGDTRRIPEHLTDPEDNLKGPHPTQASVDQQCIRYNPRCAPHSPDVNAYLPNSTTSLEVDDWSPAYLPSPSYNPTKRSKMKCKRTIAMEDTTQSGGTDANQCVYQQAGLESQEVGTTEEIEEGAVAERRVSNFTTLTNVVDILQLAPSPESQKETPLMFKDECENWSDDDDINIGTSAHSSGSRPVENCTLRKLAELRDRLKQEKEAGGCMHPERHDLLSSPDSDYSVTGAFRSPRQTRHSCAFTFRGYRIDAPATAERARRRRRPIWYVREDPGSPTPIRTNLPLPQLDVFSREEPAPHPASTSSCHVYDDESIVDMDFTGALPLATPPPKVRRRRKPRQ